MAREVGAIAIEAQRMDAVQSGRVSASGWVRWLPGIATLRSYETRWLPHDIAPAWF
jgi:hypothetical protein